MWASTRASPNSMRGRQSASLSIDTAARRVIKLIDGVGTEPWGTTMAGADNYCH